MSRDNNPDLMRQGNRFTTDTGYINRVKAFTSRFEYIGRDGDSFYVICSDCGSAFKRTINSFKPSHRRLIICPGCEELRRQKKKAERDIRLRERLEESKRKQEEKEKAKIKTCICQRCGNSFLSCRIRKYCSDVCMKRQNNSDKEHQRRIRIRQDKVDRISLKTLAKRDKNKCWICGLKVNWHDYEIRPDGSFVASENYPSIDHVQPIAKGGAHTWSNVRLAHRGCNTKKSAKLAFEEANGQIRLAL